MEVERTGKTTPLTTATPQSLTGQWPREALRSMVGDPSCWKKFGAFQSLRG